MDLTFSASVSSISVNVSINDDTIDELDELFRAALDLVSDNDRVVVAPASADILITDNDGERPCFVLYSDTCITRPHLNDSTSLGRVCTCVHT